jgi:hypothetical protein
MLINLQKFDFSEEIIIKILQNSNLEIVENMRDILSKGYLSVAFVCENIDIYYINSLKYSLLKENINLLNNYNLNPYIFKSTPEVLFSSTDRLKNNLETLASYNLLKKLKTTNNYYFLMSSELELKLDKLIELGYEFILEEDLSILNSDNLNRLEIVKLLNMELSTKEEVFEVLSSEKFYIKDEDIPSYISNIVSLKKKQNLNMSKEELESFRLTPRSYSIGGNIISSIKVDRLLSNGNDLYDSIFSNTTLNSEEYDTIIKSIEDVSTK